MNVIIIVRGNIVLQKIQTAEIDVKVKNKWCWDWLATEYEKETFRKVLRNFESQAKCIARFANKKSAALSVENRPCWTT